MTDYQTAKRPLTQAEVSAFERDFSTHEPLANVTTIEPVWRRRARTDVDVEIEILAQLLDCEPSDIIRWEDDPMTVADDSNRKWRQFLNASVLGADSIRIPDRIGSFSEKDVRRWERERAAMKRTPKNAPKSAADEMALS